MQANRRMPDVGASSSTTQTNGSTNPAAAQAAPARRAPGSTQARAPPATAWRPPRATEARAPPATARRAPAASAPNEPANRGFWSYLNAGANAGAGRDSDVGPLDGTNQ